MTATIKRWGNSQAIRLPEIFLEQLMLHENDQVELAAVDDSIVIKKQSRSRRAKKSLEERFKNYTGEYQCTEWDTGNPVGREVW